MIQGQWYSPCELHDLPSLGTGQADEQVGETPGGNQRVWIGRTEDSPAVSVETYDGNRWETTYEGEPGAIRINWNDEVEVSEMHVTCQHYQLIGGQSIQVDKDDWYDYCTAEDYDDA